MRFELIFIGKTNDQFIADGIDYYKRKLIHYATLEISIINPSKEKLTNSILKDEAEKVLKSVTSKDFLIVLDEKGKEFTSMEFAKEIQNIMNRSAARIVFAIGSAYGLGDALRKRANLIMSFSKMTFTHQMIRLILTEQTYRAMTILKGEKYHHQ